MIKLITHLFTSLVMRDSGNSGAAVIRELMDMWTTFHKLQVDHILTAPATSGSFRLIWYDLTPISWTPR